VAGLEIGAVGAAVLRAVGDGAVGGEIGVKGGTSRSCGTGRCDPSRQWCDPSGPQCGPSQARRPDWSGAAVGAKGGPIGAIGVVCSAIRAVVNGIVLW
jgi:hypothetical protein